MADRNFDLNLVGSANSFCNAIHVAMLEVENDVPALISKKVESQLVAR